MDQGKKPVLFVDAYSQIYRGFYAVRALTNSKGIPSNAVFAMAKLLLKLESGYPGHDGAFVFDKGRPRQRMELLPEYKANRPPMPEELRQQIPSIRALISAFGWQIIESEGSEADDLIGAGAKARPDREIRIVSSDKDISQVIDVQNRVTMLVPSHDGKGFTVRDYAATVEKFGVPPERIVDYLSLIGDSSDNIPGVPGIGPKTAAALIREAGSVEEMLQEPARIKKETQREKIVSCGEILRKNLKLITLVYDVPEGVSFEDDRITKKQPDLSAVSAIVQEFELKSIASEVTKLASIPAVSAVSVPEPERKQEPEQMTFNF